MQSKFEKIPMGTSQPVALTLINDSETDDEAEVLVSDHALVQCSFRVWTGLICMLGFHSCPANNMLFVAAPSMAPLECVRSMCMQLAR